MIRPLALAAALAFAAGLLIALVLRALIFQPFTIPSSSMEPTLTPAALCRLRLLDLAALPAVMASAPLPLLPSVSTLGSAFHRSPP